MFGLDKQQIDIIKQTINQFDEIEHTIIFGSRAMGNYKKGSDVDIAVKGKQITNQTVVHVSDLLNEVCPLPYFFDVLHYEDISNEELKSHINKHGVTL